jgi:hypothetical protein
VLDDICVTVYRLWRRGLSAILRRGRRLGSSKAFTLNAGKREAANFYVWDSEDAAKAFFTDQLLERVAGLYGVRPSVEFVQIAALVENREGTLNSR